MRRIQDTGIGSSRPRSPGTPPASIPPKRKEEESVRPGRHPKGMAHYLVTATPKPGKIPELGGLLRRGAFIRLRPFGGAITFSLRNARLRENGVAVWEEEDYCTPPLAQERAAVLDAFFRDLGTEPVREGEGWRRIAALPFLFPDLAGG